MQFPINYYERSELGRLNEDKPGYKAFQNLYTLSRCIHYAPAIADMLRLTDKKGKFYIGEFTRQKFFELIEKTTYANEFASQQPEKFQSGKIELLYIKRPIYRCDERDPRHHVFYLLKD